MATPSAFQCARSCWAISAHDSSSSGNRASSASRSSPASAGARPSVETATVTPPLRKTPPRYALAESVSSTALTNRARSSAARATVRFTSGGAAATTNHFPSRSAGTNSRSSTWTPGRRIESRMEGATTVTRAPAASSASSLAAATLPPPTTRTERDFNCRKTGYRSMESSLRESHGADRKPGRARSGGARRRGRRQACERLVEVGGHRDERRQRQQDRLRRDARERDDGSADG